MKPIVQTRTTAINFSVTRVGLEDQLLATVVGHERSKLEVQRQQLLRSINADKLELEHHEDRLLELLQLHAAETDGKNQFLPDVELVESLESAKKLASELRVRLDQAKTAAEILNASRDDFRSVAVRGAILFSCMGDLWRINPLYQFSLASFHSVFVKAITQAKQVC